MGIIKFSGPVVLLKAEAGEVTRFAADLDHLRLILPEQVVNFASSGNRCSFDIPGMTSIHLEVKKVVDRQSVEIASEAGIAPEINLSFQLQPGDDHNSQAKIELEAELSPFIQMLASTPLQNLVNIMSEKLSEQFGG